MDKNDKIKILLVDDHAVMRLGLVALLKTQRNLNVIGNVGDGESALDFVKRAKPDVIIMDLMMPGMSGVETTRRLLEIDPSLHILILTTYGTADDLAHALEAGARGALLKTADLPDLVAAIQLVAQGKSFVSPEIQQIMMTDPPIPELSEQQTNVLDSIIRGLSNDQIALQLNISKGRVKEHLNTLYNKLGAANRTEAVAIALRKQLLKI